MVSELTVVFCRRHADLLKQPHIKKDTNCSFKAPGVCYFYVTTLECNTEGCFVTFHAVRVCNQGKQASCNHGNRCVTRVDANLSAISSH